MTANGENGAGSESVQFHVAGELEPELGIVTILPTQMADWNASEIKSTLRIATNIPVVSIIK